MFTRSIQPDQFKSFNNNEVIKVIIGVRRAGKTILLNQLKDTLRRHGVNNNQLHFIRFPRLRQELLVDPESLLTMITGQIITNQENYLFLDGIDLAKDACLLLQKLSKHTNINLFITSSSRSFLSELSQFHTKLMVVSLLPLSFVEFCYEHHLSANRQSLYQYLNTGGFPFAQTLHDQIGQEDYLDEVFNTILVGGLTKQGNLCNPFLTKQLAIFLAQQMGNPINASKAVAGLRQMGISTSSKTITTYLHFLLDTFLFYPCYELDPVTRQPKPTNVKYYPIDPSIRNYLTSQKGALSQANLEALLFIELVRRGYTPYYSKRFTFVAERNQQQYYIKFYYSFRNQQDYDKAIANFRTIPANCRRLLIVMQNSDLLAQDPKVPIIKFTDWLTKCPIP